MFGFSKYHDCFNRLCRFHLKNGDTIVGGVTEIRGEKITVTIKHEGEENEEITFPESLVHHFDIYESRGWKFSEVRGRLFGQNSFGYSGNLNTKRLIILGAGASTDTGLRNNMAIPPLTNSLFESNELLNDFEGAKMLKSKVLTYIKAGGTLEEYFEEKWIEIRKNGDTELMARLINTQYYIHQLFKSISFTHSEHSPTNYCTLIEHIRRFNLKTNENIGVITFNYDTLFENSLNHIFEWDFSTVDDYIYQNGTKRRDILKPIMLFKPHGSWNWVHEFHDPITKREKGSSMPITEMANEIYKAKIDYAHLKFSISPKLIKTDVSLQEIPSFFSDNFRIIKYLDNSTFDYYPNLLIPFRNKDEVLMPLKHQFAMESILEDIEEILIIGWKGTEQTFNDILKRKMADKEILITYVSPNSTTTENELRNYLPKAKFKRVPLTFTNYLSKIRDNPENEFNFFNVKNR